MHSMVNMFNFQIMVRNLSVTNPIIMANRKKERLVFLNIEMITWFFFHYQRILRAFKKINE